jgi:hypothetical protein
VKSHTNNNNAKVQLDMMDALEFNFLNPESVKYEPWNPDER